jgi:hypothetical protein
MSRDLMIAGYLACAAGAVLLDLAAHRPGSRLASISDVFSLLSRQRAGRVAVMVGWWWLGWHFFVR